MAFVIGFLSWFWVLQAFYGTFKAWISRKLLLRQNRLLEEAARECDARPVVLIIPIKGIHGHFEDFLDSVLHQEYPRYRVIFVTESADDPAYQAIRSRTDEKMELVVAGLAEDEGQKVHNQLAALRRLDSEDEIVAFADGDIVGDKDWLTKLVTPLNAGWADLSTGYRWFIPGKTNRATLVAAQINTGIALMAGPNWHTLLWGGSMAMTRETLDELNLPASMRGSLNDDLQITWLARKAGRRLFFIRSLMAESPVSFTWSSLFEFGRRQYFQVRIYMPAFWGLALTFAGLYVAGFVTCVVRFGMTWDFWPLLPVLCVISFEFLREICRTQFLGELFDEKTRAALEPVKKVPSLHAFAVHFAIILSSVWIREITWAGIRYRVHGRQNVEVLRGSHNNGGKNRPNYL